MTAVLKNVAVGQWSVQDTVLRTMWVDNAPPEAIAAALGRTVSAIMTRAARLGLPRRAAPGRKPVDRSVTAVAPRRRSVRSTEPRVVTELLGTARAMRMCLMCTNAFQSVGPHNRICPKCKGSPDYESGNRLGDVEIVG